MELLACGFNAWAQLCLEALPDGDVTDEDLQAFTRVLRDGSIQRVQAFLSHTVVTCEDSSKVAGCFPRKHALLYARDPRTYSTLAEAANGAIVSEYPSIYLSVWRPCRFFPLGLSKALANSNALLSRLLSIKPVQSDMCPHYVTT